MTFRVEVGGRTRQVTVRREGQEWVVVLDGRELRADFVPAAGRWSLVIRDRGRHDSHEVVFETGVPGEAVIHVDGLAVPVGLPAGRRLFGRRHDAVSSNGPARVLAPMPGRVVKVLVEPGDTAAAGQALIVVEAMKMENELRAPRAGRVAEVRVREGMSIEARMVLITLE